MPAIPAHGGDRCASEDKANGRFWRKADIGRIGLEWQLLTQSGHLEGEVTHATEKGVVRHKFVSARTDQPTKPWYFA
jgi:hypothetical protein